MESSTPRARLLTFIWAFGLAPLSIKPSTTSRWPYWHATKSGVPPSWNARGDTLAFRSCEIRLHTRALKTLPPLYLLCCMNPRSRRAPKAGPRCPCIHPGRRRTKPSSRSANANVIISVWSHVVLWIVNCAIVRSWFIFISSILSVFWNKSYLFNGIIWAYTISQNSYNCLYKQK